MEDRNEDSHAIGLFDCLIGYQCVSPALACIYELMLLLPASSLDFKLLRDLAEALMSIEHEVFVELVRESDAIPMWRRFIEIGYDDDSTIGKVLREHEGLWSDFEGQALGYECITKWCGVHR